MSPSPSLSSPVYAPNPFMFVVPDDHRDGEDCFHRGMHSLLCPSSTRTARSQSGRASRTIMETETVAFIIIDDMGAGCFTRTSMALRAMHQEDAVIRTRTTGISSWNRGTALSHALPGEPTDSRRSVFHFLAFAVRTIDTWHLREELGSGRRRTRTRILQGLLRSYPQVLLFRSPRCSYLPSS